MIIQKADKKSLLSANRDAKNIRIDIKILRPQMSFSELCAKDEAKSRAKAIPNVNGQPQISAQIIRISRETSVSKLILSQSRSFRTEISQMSKEVTSVSNPDVRGSVTDRPVTNTTIFENNAPQSARGRVESNRHSDLWFGPSTTKTCTTARRSSLTKTRSGFRQPTPIVLKTEAFLRRVSATIPMSSRRLSPRTMTPPWLDPDLAFGTRTLRHRSIGPGTRKAACWSAHSASSRAAPSSHSEPKGDGALAIVESLSTRQLLAGQPARRSRLRTPQHAADGADSAKVTSTGADALQDRLVPDSASFLQSQVIRRLVDLAEPSSPEHDTLYARFLLESAGRERGEELCLIPILLELRVLARGGTVLNGRLSTFTYDGSLPVTDGLLTRCVRCRLPSHPAL